MTARRSAAAAALALALASLGCTQRARPRDAAPARDAARAAAADVPADAPPAAPSGVWCAQDLVSAAVSDALFGAAGGDAFAVVAEPTHDLVRAEFRWVRWGARGVDVIARAVAAAPPPGAAMALLRRAPAGYTAVWFRPPVDGGVEARAIDVEAAGFVGEERAATPAEVDAAGWVRDAGPLRRRAGALDPPPPVTAQGKEARVEPRAPRATPALVADGVEVTRGADLPGFERALGFAVADGGRRWVAVARGHCQDTRVEVFRVDGERVTLRARYLLGAELGVRWIRIDPRADEALVTWYQTLIPLRMDCARGPAGLLDTERHGVRVARVKAEGEEPAPLPSSAPDAGAESSPDAAADVPTDAPAGDR